MGDSVPVPHIASDQWELAWTSLMNTQTNFFTSVSQKMYNSTIENLDKPAAQQTNNEKDQPFDCSRAFIWGTETIKI